MTILTEQFIYEHPERIKETDLEEAQVFIESMQDDKLQKALGVLYPPIVQNDWDSKSLAFCGGELSKEDVIRLGFFFVSYHFNEREFFEHKDTEKTEELNFIYFD